MSFKIGDKVVPTWADKNEDCEEFFAEVVEIVDENICNIRWFDTNARFPDLLIRSTELRYMTATEIAQLRLSGLFDKQQDNSITRYSGKVFNG